MSYVECMECGDRLKYVAPAHLKKHGLTSKQYRQKYPRAPMRSEDLRKEHSDFRRGMRLNRNCRKCGKPFTTGSPKGYYCRECQRVRDFLRRREASLRYFRRLRNSGKVDVVGTFGESYLEVVNGRVRGAVLLKKDVSFIISDRSFFKLFPYSGSPPIGYDAQYLMIFLIVCERQKVCSDCGSELTVARENGQYTIPAEICCKKCGVVYRESSVPCKREDPRGKIWLPRYVRRDPSVKETFGRRSID